MMKAVSFMYVRPPGFNAESAKAAEIADEMKQNQQQPTTEGTSAMYSFPFPEFHMLLSFSLFIGSSFGSFWH